MVEKSLRIIRYDFLGMKRFSPINVEVILYPLHVNMLHSFSGWLLVPRDPFESLLRGREWRILSKLWVKKLFMEGNVV